MSGPAAFGRLIGAGWMLARNDALLPRELEPLYPPAVYRDLVLEFYRANYFHQEEHCSESAMQAAE